MHNTHPLILIVLDGWGFSENPAHNAILQAATPTWHKLWNTYPHTLLEASGLSVGLPPGQMGNSEVGHMTIGAGRVIYQDLTRINLAINDGSFFANPVLQDALQKTTSRNSALHIIGLLSKGGIHSHEEQIAALIEMANVHKVQKIYLHAILDGRDTPPKSAAVSLAKFAPYVVSIMGRFYAMDRDNRTERTKVALDLLIDGQAQFYADDPLNALEYAYSRGETDEFVSPTQIKAMHIEDDDVVICMNFRADRMRQLCYGMLGAMPSLQQNLYTLTSYDKNLQAQVIYPPETTEQTLGEVLAKHNLSQLRIAETEKYAHVTFFFDAGKDTPNPLEKRVLISSPKVATYDLAPEMSARQITDAIVGAIHDKTFDVIICNYANADMVGHTGNLGATITAIETIDTCLAQIVHAITAEGGSMLITADHGNAETMWDDKTKQPHTAHTTNLVPLIYIGPQALTFKTDKVYGLLDIAPTMLELLHIAKPEVMTGTSLIRAD